MSQNFQSEYGDKLYGRLMERWHTLDHCQSSPVLVYDLVKEVESWIESKLENSMIFYDDDWNQGYNDAINTLLKDLK
jgi:hypothetical protein